MVSTQVLLFVQSIDSSFNPINLKRTSALLAENFMLKQRHSKGGCLPTRVLEGRKEMVRRFSECLGARSDPKTIEAMTMVGVAEHYAALSDDHKRIVEDGYKRHLIDVIVCTTTLAAGVNLPAARVIIRCATRYDRRSPRDSLPEDRPSWSPYRC